MHRHYSCGLPDCAIKVIDKLTDVYIYNAVCRRSDWLFWTFYVWVKEKLGPRIYRRKILSVLRGVSEYSGSELGLSVSLCLSLSLSMESGMVEWSRLRWETRLSLVQSGINTPWLIGPSVCVKECCCWIRKNLKREPVEQILLLSDQEVLDG